MPFLMSHQMITTVDKAMEMSLTEVLYFSHEVKSWKVQKLNAPRIRCCIWFVFNRIHWKIIKMNSSLVWLNCITDYGSQIYACMICTKQYTVISVYYFGKDVTHPVTGIHAKSTSQSWIISRAYAKCSRDCLTIILEAVEHYYRGPVDDWCGFI